MLHKIEFHSKWNVIKNGVTQNGMLLKWNVTQNEMSPKRECQLKLIFTQHRMSHKMEHHSKWNVTQIGMSLKMECHS